jgi:hypothetical protein
MIPSIRQKFNDQYTEEKYKKYLAQINSHTAHPVEFRIAETPVFIPKNFKNALLSAGDEIISILLDASTIQHTQKAIPMEAVCKSKVQPPGCIILDFAIASDMFGNVIPKLIELQGFPSLFGFEVLQNQALLNNYHIETGFNNYLNDYNETSYIAHLQKMIKGKENKHTILLEIFPHQQKTSIDFYITQQLISIPIVCVSELYIENNKLYYNKEGEKHLVERIYNRVVFDELKNQSLAIQEKGAYLQQVTDVEWVTHPHHFFTISKYSLPYLNHPSVPSTQFLNQVENLPADLSKYILKPLFSFAGQGVEIDINLEMIQNIPDSENWILQEKVAYADCIVTPTGNAKAEIRLFYFWDENKNKYIATNNLTRLSKGKMIGVNYNKTATWVGGSLAYFEI